ncbi:FAD-dependent oxidoreductase [Macrococcus equipercicus]|uniref:FAD-dependent oxidoreductase n=1 Tax=Macrococcus equipercicus TaxID=69967 RepID=A0ABQ6R6I4_9STAP|nr:FAD-dependent oxidoreductase [Macrococcus equipercicus]
MKTYDLIIIGAGVTGLSIARQLPKDMSIAIIDHNTTGLNASYAAGGMLGAQNEFFRDTPLYRLSLEGRRMMPDVIAALEEETGITVHLQQHGLLKYLSSDADRGKLQQQYQFLKSHDPDIQLLGHEELQRLIPDLSARENSAGIFIKDDGQLDVSCYVPALRQSLSHFTWIDGEVLSVSHGYTVVADNNSYIAPQLVIAAGAWSGDLLAQLGIELPVDGMRGEVCLVHQPDLTIRQTIFGTNGCYIVPKHSGHYLVGATSCRDRLHKVTAAGKDWLLTTSREMIPVLSNGTVVKHYSGVRPYTPALYMDECLPGLFTACGHYRNGILLSAVTGHYMAELIQGRRHPLLEHFTIKEAVYDTHCER